MQRMLELFQQAKIDDPGRKCCFQHFLQDHMPVNSLLSAGQGSMWMVGEDDVHELALYVYREVTIDGIVQFTVN